MLSLTILNLSDKILCYSWGVEYCGIAFILDIEVWQDALQVHYSFLPQFLLLNINTIY